MKFALESGVQGGADRKEWHELTNLIDKRWRWAWFRGSFSQLVPSSSVSICVEWRKFPRNRRLKRTGLLPQTLGGVTVRTQMIATTHVPWDAGKVPGELANLHNKCNVQELWVLAVRPLLYWVSKNTWGTCFRKLVQEACSRVQTNNFKASLEDFPEIPVVMGRLCLWLLPIFTSAFN